MKRFANQFKILDSGFLILDSPFTMSATCLTNFQYPLECKRLDEPERYV